MNRGRKRAAERRDLVLLLPKQAQDPLLLNFEGSCITAPISHWVRMKIHTQTSWRNRPAHEIKTQPVRKQASKRQEAGRHTVLSPDDGTFSTAFPGDRHYQRRTLTWMWCIFLPVPIQYLSPLPFLSKPAISDPQHLSAAKSLKGLISKKDAPGLCYQSYLILHLPWA